MAKPTFKELAEALDKALHHAYSKGRLVESGQKAAADDQHTMMIAEREKLVRFLRDTFLSVS